MRWFAIAVVGGVQTAVLLRRLRTEFDQSGQLSAPSVAWMYATYGAHAAATAVALTRQGGQLPLPRRMPWLGIAAACAGAGLTLAGMTRFAGPRQISGTQTGSLVASGVYRYSRNPQYAGYVLQLAGLAFARRSGTAAALAAAAAAAFRWWVPTEERHLEREFGDSYRDYRRQTPRWLGVTPRRAQLP